MNRLYFTKKHIIVEILSYVIVLASLILCILGMANVNGDIPIHFNFKGEVTGTGSPGTILILPITMIMSNALISVLAHFLPVNMWNMPFKVREEAKIPVYRDVALMLMLMELFFAIGTLLFIFEFIYIRSGARILLTMSIIVWTVAPALDVILTMIIANIHNRS